MVVLATPGLSSQADALAGWLRDRHVTVWTPRDVPIGSRIDDEIESQTRAGAALVLLVGEHAVVDFAKREVAAAAEESVPVVPIVFSAADPDLPHLRAYQWLTISQSTDDLLAPSGGTAVMTWLDEVGSQLEEVAKRGQSQASGDPEDPHKGQWGGRSNVAGRKLTADVRPLGEYWFEVELTLRRTGGAPLAGDAVFYLHPRNDPSIRSIAVENGRATTTMRTWGAFTVGATSDGGTVRLELDLASLSAAPEAFRER